MFGFFKKKQVEIVSPVDGSLVELEDINDQVFSKKLVGDGVAIVPSSRTITSPIDGVVTRIFPTKHAFMITSPSGIEVMVHVGLDTVDLNGEGFICLVKEGDSVSQACPILEVDFEFLKSKNKDIVTPIIVTSDKEITLEKSKIGTIREGESLVKVKFI
ncbi:MAG: PTS glucose transporter subunit IIA [Sulfurovum sp.]|nr:MAG: PTS glucose transporter subunit IIA [Sulfurovum sp.]